MKQLPHILYIIVAIGCLIGRLLTDPLSTQLDYIFKPLLMPILVWIVFTAKSYPNKALLIIALIFAWGGDIALMLGRSGLIFIAGLASFLIMQILYILIFKKDWAKPSFLKKHPIWSLPFIAIGASFYLLSVPKLSTDIIMLIAVFIYATALTGMTLSALNRKEKVEVLSWQYVFIGAVFFLFSDLMIGASKFIVDDFAYSGFVIMVTYIIGQYLIVKGLTND